MTSNVLLFFLRTRYMAFKLSHAASSDHRRSGKNACVRDICFETLVRVDLFTLTSVKIYFELLSTIMWVDLGDLDCEAL